MSYRVIRAMLLPATWALLVMLATGLAAAPARETTSAGSGPMAISWMNRPEIYQEDTYTQQYMEQRFDVDITMYPIPWGEYQQKQQLILASGEIPDVIWMKTPGDLRKFADQGFLAELSPATVAEHAPRMSIAIDQYAPEGWYYTAYEGRTYGFPGTAFNGQCYDLSGWRTDLLQDAGVDFVPQTLEQYTQAFAALQRIGVFGMTSKGDHALHAFHTVFGAFGIMPPYWTMRDGRVVNSSTTAEARAALTLLADWYAKGYIDPEFVTGKDIGAKYIAGKFAYQDLTYELDLDATNARSQLAAMRLNDTDAAVALTKPPVGPGGQGNWVPGNVGNLWSFGRQVADQPAKQQRILEIFDVTLNDEETYLRLHFGVQGEHWDFTEGVPNFIAPYNERANREGAGFPSSYGSMNIWTGQAHPDIASRYWNPRRWEACQTYSVGKDTVFGQPDILPSSSSHWEDLLRLKIETYAAIIRGDRPVSAFDEFVRQWNRLGGEQLEREANELYQSTR